MYAVVGLLLYVVISWAHGVQVFDVTSRRLFGNPPLVINEVGDDAQICAGSKERLSARQRCDPPLVGIPK